MAHRSGTNVLKGFAVSLALLTGVAPAAADMRHSGYGYERVEFVREIPRGCGPRARARGWCHGERIGPRARLRAERQLHRPRPEPRYLPRGTRIDPPRRERDGLGLALGIAGLAAGALIVGSIANERSARPAPRFDAPPAPTPGPKPLPRYGDRDAFPDAPQLGGGIDRSAPGPAPATNPYEPWSTAWLEACRERYRSFNERTGTFRTYDGRDRFCTGPR